MAQIVTVTDSKTGWKKSVFVAPAGLSATAYIAISSISNARCAFSVAAAADGRYVMTDAAGAEMGRYNATEQAASIVQAEVNRAAGPVATPKQIAYLTRLVAEPPYELRGYADRIKASVGPAMSKADASRHIAVLTWADDAI